MRGAHFTAAAAQLPRLITGVSLISFSADDMTARQPRLLARNSEGVALMAAGEPSEASARFGEAYERYKSEVPAFVPHFGGLIGRRTGGQA